MLFVVIIIKTLYAERQTNREIITIDFLKRFEVTRALHVLNIVSGTQTAARWVDIKYPLLIFSKRLHPAR